MRTTNYLLKFAKMNEESQIFTLSRAFSINEEQAKTMIEQLTNELKTQEMLLHQVKSKQDVTNAALVEKLQQLKAKSKNAKAETKNQRFLRLHFYDIKRMREQNYSWQEISKYLAKEHKRKINYTTVLRTYKELEQKMNL
jgi:GTPase involved in cell partitioning and DNA repair